MIKQKIKLRWSDNGDEIGVRFIVKQELYVKVV